MATKHDPIKSVLNRTYWFRKARFQKKYLSGREQRTEDTKYYIIYREDPYAGLGSYIITSLGQFRYAEEQGLIPVVDMKHFINPYISYAKINRVNAWNYYFDNPFLPKKTDIDQVYREGDYVSCGGEGKSPFPGDPLTYQTDSEGWRDWNRLFRKYMPLRPEVEREALLSYEEKIKILQESGAKVMGVLLRGTDYVSLKPSGHPVQPTITQAIEGIREYKERWNAEYIFLVTEDIEIQNAVVKEFGDQVILPKAEKYEYREGKYIGELRNKRKNDRYLHGLEYLISLWMLGKCNFFLAGRTSGSAVACVMAEEFEDVHFWDLGLYPDH